MDVICKTCGNFGVVVEHHIDGNRENNDITNRILICPTCHYLIHYRRYELRLESDQHVLYNGDKPVCNQRRLKEIEQRMLEEFETIYGVFQYKKNRHGLTKGERQVLGELVSEFMKVDGAQLVNLYPSQDKKYELLRLCLIECGI